MCDKQSWFVDGVRDITEFDDSEIIPPSKITKNQNTYISGIYRNDNNELIQIIDLGKIADVNNNIFED